MLKTSIRQHAHIEQMLDLEVDNQRQQEMRRKWNKRLKDPLAFVPHSERDRTTPKKAAEENAKLGQFAVNYMRKAISRFAGDDDSARVARLCGWRKILAVGFGKNYDSEWLKEATEAGLETWWIDVSDVACRIARKKLARQWSQLSKDPGQTWGYLPRRPSVVRSEIRSLLAKPEEEGLDPDTIDIWYFCRFLGCLSDSSADRVLRYVGETSLSSDGDPDRKKSVVIVNALLDFNPDPDEMTTTVRSKANIMESLTRGAGRQLRLLHEEKHTYFSKIVSAITIMAKGK